MKNTLYQFKKLGLIRGLKKIKWTVECIELIFHMHIKVDGRDSGTWFNFHPADIPASTTYSPRHLYFLPTRCLLNGVYANRDYLWCKQENCWTTSFTGDRCWVMGDVITSLYQGLSINSLFIRSTTLPQINNNKVRDYWIKGFPLTWTNWLYYSQRLFSANLNNLLYYLPWMEGRLGSLSGGPPS